MNVKTIMMAEDDSEDFDLFKDALTDLEFDISLKVAVNGKELMTQLEHSKPWNRFTTPSGGRRWPTCTCGRSTPSSGYTK